MIDFDKIKEKAVEYANKFCKEEYEILEDDKKKYNCKEWYLIINLSQIYYNLMKNIYTREQAKIKQKEEFEFAKLYFED